MYQGSAPDEPVNVPQGTAADVNAQNPNPQFFGGSNAEGVIDALITKVEFLLSHFDLWNEDDCFTFPDGETWERRHSHVLEVEGDPSSLTFQIERALLHRHPVTLPRERARNYAELAAWVIQGGQ